MGTYLIDNIKNLTGSKHRNYSTAYSFLEQNFSESETSGDLKIVTGFVTIGMLSKLYELLEKKYIDKIDHYQIILGDLVEKIEKNERPIKLLNDIDNAFKINQEAKNAEEFVKLNKVSFRTTDPNFCHGKVYIFKEKDEPKLPRSFFLIGSSNLTEKGLGYFGSIENDVKKRSNFELNITFDEIRTVKGDMNKEFEKVESWFNELWDVEKENSTDIKKLYTFENGRKKLIDQKNIREYLLNEIKNYYKPYSPKEIYYKILFEWYKNEIDERRNNPDFIRKIAQVEHTVVFQALFQFQKEGVYNLINMIKNYNGAILADAVGLGKTWSALAVMKFFEIENYEVILLCPKKLEKNWKQYLYSENSKFKRDVFNYKIFFHTDLQGDNDSERLKKVLNCFEGLGNKLIVIDESHNLRNSASKKYRNLMDKILKKARNENRDIKVLLLSATPINNELDDIKNQIMLIAKDDKKAFEETDIEIENIERVFNKTKEEFKNWYEPKNKNQDKSIGELVERVPDFFKIIDSLSVSRTRNIITQNISENDKKYLRFPDKTKGIDNVYKTPEITGFKSFDELLDLVPVNLPAYKPSMYVAEDFDIKKTTNQQNREERLGNMIKTILIKRLESSWLSFKSTLEVVLEAHKDVLKKVELFNDTGKDDYIKNIDEEELEEEENSQLSLLNNTKEKAKYKISDLKNLIGFKNDIVVDINSMEYILKKLEFFGKEIESEKTIEISKDTKLKVLMDKIIEKRKNQSNNNNNKVLIFTAYKDTALYLFNELKKRGFNKIGLVSGDYNCTDDSNVVKKDFEDILQRFAPYTKIFKEKEWLDYKPANARYEYKEDYSINYENWKKFLIDNGNFKLDLEKLNSPIDILIATDCISEGQNLQDCDYVVNYDIHWNPVRVVQRMGRIDRLGSPNDSIKCLNFWPADSINNYLKLQTRIEAKMIGMKFAGSEIDKDFTENLSKKLTDGVLDKKQSEKMLLQIDSGKFENVERSNKDILFSDMSIQGIKNSFFYEMEKNYYEYQKMPHGIYSGFKAKADYNFRSGLIALLKHKVKRQGETIENLKLIYIDEKGNDIKKSSSEIIGFLNIHLEHERYVSKAIDECDKSEIEKLSGAITRWIENESEKQDDYFLNDLQESENKPEQIGIKFQSEDFEKKNFDLITWVIVSNQ